MVVTKFIDKSKIAEENLIPDPTTGSLRPVETALLTTLLHENVVNVIDVAENGRFVQMVMERHGSGMDLFEFIDRGPRTDEPINSYIFRQVGRAN